MDELRKLVKEFFADDIMQWVGSDHHKQQDGALEITYSYYYDNECQDIGGSWYWAWTVCHPGYVRGCIEGRGKTLEEAIVAFRKDWEEKKKEWEDSPGKSHKIDPEGHIGPRPECPEALLHINENGDCDL